MRAFRRSRTGPRLPSRFLADIPPHLTVPAKAPSLPAPPRVRAAGAALPLKAGAKVRHARFGEGIVISCVPSGDDHLVTVAFKGEAGIKKLLLSMAGLEPMG